MINKGQGIRDICNTLGISPEEVIAFGDAENDIPMLDGADYAFCPADGVVADRFPNVCKCDDGAIADVIYKKIPEILEFQP